MQMTCPKCHGQMRVYERSGVTVDQCSECRGIFLDRGELEKLFEAESSYNSRPATPPPPASAPPRPAAAPQPGYGQPQPGGYAPPPPPPAPGYGQPGYGQPAHGGYPAPAYGHHGHYRHGHHGHYHRRKSFLHNLFD
ncbi:zf-TFIIB domain-containing protein [Actinoplanes sp. LDG1-06]|uniref:Zf-TFIIB domain-containing protein n=1 Tax=Paractinoplanes ovalisporus TaxID=2810368 RepID=A0ABS2AAR4_9ACTN|nr:zf-TFIIB domain-containing protein [Actinoplanes ovalisporus]MBM2616927.1 zf-TFIIB domain-containing protein [Actinoplanes ovalisporus]